MSVNVLIINMRDETLEYVEDSIDAALDKYVDEQIGFGSAFSVDRAKWHEIADTEHTLSVKISLINGLCKLRKDKIKKVITNYSYNVVYPVNGDAYEGVIYKKALDNSSYSVCGFDPDDTRSVLTIASEYKNLPVTAIDTAAFEGNRTLKDLFIPITIRFIGNAAFYDCTNLKTIRFEGDFAGWNAICDPAKLFNRSENYDVATIFKAAKANLNGWVNSNGKWYYYEESVLVKNAWRSDTGGEVYLGSDGAMRVNTWIEDSNGWCFVNSEGYRIKNHWLKDTIGWCYLDEDGYIICNDWQQDSVGWCYLDYTGHLVTSKWIEYTDGYWYYLGTDGRMLTNCWQQDNWGWCWLNNDGKMAKSTYIYDTDAKLYYWVDSYGHWNNQPGTPARPAQPPQ